LPAHPRPLTNCALIEPRSNVGNWKNQPHCIKQIPSRRTFLERPALLAAMTLLGKRVGAKPRDFDANGNEVHT